MSVSSLHRESTDSLIHAVESCVPEMRISASIDFFDNCTQYEHDNFEHSIILLYVHVVVHLMFSTFIGG